MGKRLYEVKWEAIGEDLSEEEADFVRDHFAEMDRRTNYAVSAETITELREGMSKAQKKHFSKLFKILWAKCIEADSDIEIAIGE